MEYKEEGEDKTGWEREKGEEEPTLYWFFSMYAFMANMRWGLPNTFFLVYLPDLVSWNPWISPYSAA